MLKNPLGAISSFLPDINFTMIGIVLGAAVLIYIFIIRKWKEYFYFIYDFYL